MGRANIALLVAIVSATLAAVGTLWQFLLYRLSGPRLIVRLAPAILSSDNTIIRGPEEGFEADLPAEMAQVLNQWTVDLAEEQITNVGRAPISVSEIALDLGPTAGWGRRRRHTVRGFPIALHGSATEEVIRLESGESTRVLFDLWAIVDGIRKRGRKRVTVRASAQAAGRRPRRSPWRKRWVFDAGRQSLRPGEKVTPALRAYRALWRSLASTPGGLEQVQLAWGTIVETLKEQATADDLASALEAILGPGQHGRAYLVLTAFLGEERHPDRAAEKPSPPSRTEPSSPP